MTDLRAKNRALGLVGGLTFAAAVAVALVGGLAMVQAIEDLVGAPTPYSAPTVGLQGAGLKLVGARGDTLTFYLTQTSPKGLWATPSGLRLELANANTGFKNSDQVASPKQKDWEDPVFAANAPFVHAFEDVHVHGSLTVPDVPGPETQTLAGRLLGEFVYPGSTQDGMHFQSVSRDLNIPATLEVVSAAESERIDSHFRWVRYGRIALGLLYFVVAMAYALSYGMWRDAEQTRRWEPYLTLAAGAGVWACVGALWLSPFGA